MSQPTEYQRQYSFTAFQGSNPDDPLPAVKIELELNAIKTTLDQIRTNLALIQRDDGELANSSVGTAQLEATLTTLGFDRPTSWLTATAYAVDAAVFEANKLYFCLVAHTSGTFATDLAAAKWTEVVDFTTLVTDAEAAADAAAVSAAAAAASAASAAAVVAAALPLAGGTMLGPIVTSADASLATQAPRLSQVQSGVVQHATSTGGSVDSITTVHSPVRTAWVAGMRGTFTAAGANTTSATEMNPDGIGAKTFLKNNLQALVAGDIAGAGHEVEWEYNGTNLILLNPAILAASTSEVLTGTNTTKNATPDAIAALWEAGSDIADGATITIGEGGYFNLITSTTAITAFSITTNKTGRTFRVRFNTARTLTHNATSLIIPGGASITTAAGDIAQIRSLGGGNVVVEWYTKASGLPVVSAAQSSMTLLGTLTTTSGTTQSITGIAAGYRKFYVEIEDVSFSGNVALTMALSSTNGAAYGSASAIAPVTGGAAGATHGWVDVGAVSSTTTAAKSFVAVTRTASAHTVTAGECPTNTAAVADAIQFAGGTFDAGTIRVYGVK